MKEDMVKLSEVLEKINGFITGSYDQEYLDKWCSCIKFVPKISTREKYLIINEIINNKSYSENIVDSFVELEMNKFWYGMLYYTNIDITDVKLLTEDNYDVLSNFMSDWIMGYIDKDYTLFLKMFDLVWNYTNSITAAQAMIETIQDFGNSNQKKDEDILEFIKNNPKTLRDLSQIAVMGSQFVIPDIDDKE